MTKEDSHQHEEHPAATAFAAVLEAIAAAAEDVQDDEAELILRECHQWVAHLTKGTAPPVTANAVHPQRDWEGAKSFAVQIIRREKDFLTTRIDDFRQMIWVVIQGLREAFRDEQTVDDEVEAHLDHLRTVAVSDSVDELRREIVDTVAVIGRALEERKKRQRLQLEDLGAQLSRMRGELLRAQRELALDPMTRLYNRRSLEELVEKTIELSVMSGQPACLMLIDVDHFKSVNDTFGHATGDRVIQAVAGCLQKTFPRKRDFVARYGGDEFVVVLQDTELRDGDMLAQRLLASKGESCVKADDGTPIALSLSIGVAALQAQDERGSWFSRADAALYEAKKAGRGCVRTTGG